MKETATRTAGTRGKPLEPNLEPIQPFSRRPRKVAAEAAVLALSDAELASVSVKLSDAAQETVQNAPAATVLTPAPEAILSPAAEAQSEPAAAPAPVDLNALLAKHLETIAEPKSTKGRVMLRSSSVDKPVKLVHAIAQQMYEADHGVQRKDVVAACEALGIATHTARTQYQIWLQARRADESNAGRTIPTNVQRTTPKLLANKPS